MSALHEVLNIQTILAGTDSGAGALAAVLFVRLQ